MKAATYKIDAQGIIYKHFDAQYEEENTQLAICFGSKNLIGKKRFFDLIQNTFPKAEIVLGSTSGEIFQNEINDDTISIAAISFDKTPFKTLEVNVKEDTHFFELGKNIFQNLNQDDLAYIFVLSDGNLVNGSELIKGINHHNTIKVTGGMAGDGIHFQETLVGLNQTPTRKKIVAIGFYGKYIKVGHGSDGGWEEFGLSREITKASHNTVYEVNHQNILDLYKRYLGQYAKDLPGSALFFPLSLSNPETDQKVVRTILSIDEKNKSITFAGDMPTGSRVRLMKSNPENTIYAANNATHQAKTKELNHPKLAILISCVGRRMLLNNRTEEELEEVLKVLERRTPVCGFYSYGEISPIEENSKSMLHNQTMTITLIDELP